MSKDTDLLKIQVLADYFHSHINFASSFIASSFIALLVLLLTIYYQGVLGEGINAMALVVIGSLALYGILGVYGLMFVIKRYDDYMDIIDDLLKRVEKEESLPSLSELKKLKKKRTKEGNSEENGNETKHHKLWYLGIMTSLGGSLLIACAVQSVNSSGLVRILWLLFYILAGTVFFGTCLKAGKIMTVSRHYIRGLGIAMIAIVIFGLVGILLTEI